ncbi:hypothetical protein IGI37_002051 [Enterococcus sp. AZ194]|uniref:hypothetical protein n=1 Tax=Enterococcus sp. AZ194 TaxID=2774629 RepID=UPI003F255553
MKTLSYAVASIRYHKKFSIIYSLFFTLFLFLFTLLLNLKKMILLLHTQVATRIALIESQLKEPAATPPLDSHQVTEVTHIYESVLYVLMGLFLLLAIFMLTAFFRLKKAEVLQWRIVGLRFREILRLLLVESLLPAVVVTLVIGSILFVFQTTYETLLQTINFQVLHWLNLNDYTVSVATQAAENHSYVIGLPFDNVSLFKVDFTNQFWLSDIFITTLQVFCAMAIAISFIISSISLFFIKHWTKKGRWSR